MNKRYSFAIALIVTGLALVYSLWDVDLPLLGATLSRGDYWAYFPFLSGLVVFFVLKAHRWAVILRPLGFYTWKQVFPAMMIGFAGNNIFPAHLGEIARIVVFSRRYHESLSGIFVSLLIERMLDVAAILCIYVWAVNVLEPDIEALRIGAWLAAIAVTCACAGMYLVMKWPGITRRIWQTIGARLPESIRHRGDWLLTSFVSGISVLRSPLSFCYLLLNSLVQWLIIVVLAWLSLRAFGQSPSIFVTILLVASTALAVTVPSAPGYVGAIQAAFVFALTPFGVPAEAALAASVLFLVGQWIPVTATGFVCFLATGLQFSETRNAVEAADHASR